MTLKNGSFPASAAFDVIDESLSSSDAERREAIQKGKAIFGFTLKNKEGKEDSWFIDLKDTGKVTKKPPKKADGMSTLMMPGSGVVLSLSDEDFGKLVSGKANAQKLYMSGKLKIKGNVMKATAVEPIFKKVQGKAKL